VYLLEGYGSGGLGGRCRSFPEQDTATCGLYVCQISARIFFLQTKLTKAILPKVDPRLCRSTITKVMVMWSGRQSYLKGVGYFPYSNIRRMIYSMRSEVQCHSLETPLWTVNDQVWSKSRMIFNLTSLINSVYMKSANTAPALSETCHCNHCLFGDLHTLAGPERSNNYFGSILGKTNISYTLWSRMLSCWVRQ